MLAYGDDALEVSLGQVLDGFERRLASASWTLEERRLQLIFAGQLQQAAEDQELRCAARTRKLTSAAADAFVAAADGHRVENCQILEALHTLQSSAAAEERAPIKLRTPEGFAWYALYPDAYVQAAHSWMQGRTACRVLIVGIRSIGTTLAAAVSAALRSRGFGVQVRTLRPSGHPFQRQSNLPEMSAQDAEHAIVVDEGPGLSGSSMASVADALRGRGFDADTITFFPGHSNGPGPQGSEAVRHWWRSVNQVVSPWHPADRLASAAAGLLGAPLAGPLVDIGGGQWRRHHHHIRQPVLGIAPLFESPKYLARSANGDLVLKFSGLSLGGIMQTGKLLSGAEMQWERLQRLAGKGLTPAPSANSEGWIALPWIKGRNLTPGDATEPILRHVAGYIRLAAEAPLEAPEAHGAYSRLRSLLCTNSRHLLGEEAGVRADRLSDALMSDIEHLDIASCGDGRLAPHEWIDTGDRILKLDAAGHARDHTAIGAQTMLWDVAGAAVDWELPRATACDLAQFSGARGVSGNVISYYCAAYAAYRAGLLHYCIAGCGSIDERHALTIAQRIYAERLRSELQRMDTFLPVRTYIQASPRYAT